MQIGDVKIEILTRSESVRYLGQLITFQHQETTEIKNRDQDSLGDVSQIQAGADFKKLLPQTPSPTVRRSNNFDATVSPTIYCASGTWAPAKERERMLQSAQRKMLRLINQTKRRYKKIAKHKVKNSEDELHKRRE